jgi:hypothetical protein
MRAPEIEVGQSDPGSLARSTTAKINGSVLKTPDLALDVSYSRPVGPEVLAQREFKGRTTLVEVYRTLTVDRINDCLGGAEEAETARRKLEAELGGALRRASDVGGLPVLMLALTDNSRNPINAVPEKAVLTFVMDLLWRHENRVIVPPLLGVLPKGSQYEALLREFTLREETVRERWVMAAIPSTYRPAIEEIIGKYWRAGARAFALDMQGRGFSGNSSAITLVQRTLGKLRRDSGEPFLLHAINSKEKVGALDRSRTNCLIGSAFGFDTVGLNHIPPRGFGAHLTPSEEVAKVSILQASDYGYHSLGELRRQRTSATPIELDTFAFDSESIDALLRRPNPDHARVVAKKHNLTKSLRETAELRSSLAKGRFASYVGSKARVVDDYAQAKEIIEEVRHRRVTLDNV